MGSKGAGAIFGCLISTFPQHISAGTKCDNYSCNKMVMCCKPRKITAGQDFSLGVVVLLGAQSQFLLGSFFRNISVKKNMRLKKHCDYRALNPRN